MTQHQLFVVLCWILAAVAGFALGKMFREWRNTKKGLKKKQGIDMSQYKNLNEVHDKIVERRAKKLQEEARQAEDYGKLSHAANAVKEMEKQSADEPSASRR